MRSRWPAAPSTAKRRSRSKPDRSSRGTSARSRRRGSAPHRTASPASAIRSPAAGAAPIMRSYGDVDWRVTDPWQLDLAVRWEDFEDFGTTTNGKVATNYRFNEAFAIRGSWSTGFRAPTPGQSNASNVTTQFDPDLGELVNQGTIPSTNPVAVLRGGEALEPEESQSFSVGAVLELGDFTLDGGLLHHRGRRPHRGLAGLQSHAGGSGGAGGFGRHQRGESAELPLLHQRLRYRDQGHRPRGDLRGAAVRRQLQPQPRLQQQQHRSDCASTRTR